jgi:hypothetical protein
MNRLLPIAPPIDILEIAATRVATAKERMRAVQYMNYSVKREVAMSDATLNLILAMRDLDAAYGFALGTPSCVAH